ncbi:hypothetical protein V8E36_005189 [Tilletia maclaganii]
MLSLSSSSSTPALSLSLLLLLCSLPAHSQAFGQQHRRIPLDSIRTLTFYRDELTTARRTAPVPQLSCVGKACRRFQPEVVQCTSMGDWQWKCEADLPEWLRLGKVEVSCEGWDNADDPTVLSGSCGLTYKLHESAHTRSHSSSHSGSYGSSSGGIDWFALLFWLIFLGTTAFIIYSWYLSLFPAGTRTRWGTGLGSGGAGGGGWWPGGGGGGWWPGGGGGGGPSHGTQPAPPPYSKHGTDPASSSTGWRPGFWTGLAAGVAADRLMNQGGSSSRQRQQEQQQQQGGSFFGRSAAWGRDDDDDRFGNGGGFGGFRGGSSGSRFGGGGGGGEGSGSGSMRRSTGFGGTRNR